MDKIIIKGARENNLKNINIELPKNKLIVMTGLSGSGKSTLAFDTIYQEGQRRYVESLSSYARQFLGGLKKPDVDLIEGLSPSISIDQKTTSNNPRSTVGTVTEIYDYLRILFARIGVPHCPTHKIPIESVSIDEMINQVLNLEIGTKIQVLAPIVTNQKGTFKDLLEEKIKEGYVRAKIDGEIVDLPLENELEKNKKHNISLIVDRIIIRDNVRSRLYEALETGTRLADGKVIVDIIGDKEVLYNSKCSCIKCGFSMPNLEPALFSFNSPLGSCPACHGLGTKMQLSEDLVVDYSKSLNDGAIIPLKNTDDGNIQNMMVETVCRHFDIDMNIPFGDVERKKQEIILFGTKEMIHYKFKTNGGRTIEKTDGFEGLMTNLERRYFETSSQWIHDWLDNYMVELDCPVCQGKRLTEEVLSVLISGKNIFDFTDMSLKDLYNFINNLKLDEEKKQISKLAIDEISSRLSFLLDVGLEYLTLSRKAGTLSGGEAQRIRLATQIGSMLTGVLYVLDEPSIGLHQKDNEKLINSLEKMRDLGNTLIVVEHDDEIMRRSDYLVDIGPGAGIHGGNIVASGTAQEVMDNPNSITGQYLSGKLKIDVPKTRRKPNGKYIRIKGAKENNLKNIDVNIPLGMLVCVTGVSGSGKSSLVNEVLYKGIATNLYKLKEKPGDFDEIKSDLEIDKIIDISQSPIGRTPRSNPATYTGVFDDIRDLFSQTNGAKVRGYSKGRFSFNVRGGRCEACCGDGVKRISMQFLPDVYVNCSVCNGTRYNSDTLDIKYKGKNIAEVLNMTISDALEFFYNIPKIASKLQTLCDVGLGYITLGQSATTLSGGEAQRVKLASELQKRITNKTLYILDEPTTGLHVDDVKRLIAVIERIVDNGGSVVVIEHNLDVIKVSDYIIDLGPNGGEGGGQIIGIGTPEELSKNINSYTGQYLKKILN